MTHSSIAALPERVPFKKLRLPHRVMTSTACLLAWGGTREESEGRNSGGVGGAAVAAPVLFEEANILNRLFRTNFGLQCENCSIVAL